LGKNRASVLSPQQKGTKLAIAIAMRFVVRDGSPGRAKY
jgi:hypothetical protein